MNDVYKRIEECGVIPVAVIDDAALALPLAKAIREGGMNCIEVTFRTIAASESIRMIRDTYPDMLIGAGTVLTTGQADEAIDAGAKCIVSPGLNPEMVEYCQKKEIPIIPGVMTPTEIELAMRMKLTILKYFPSEANGGIKMIKAISAPYPMVRFMPTGGINAENVSEYLKYDKVIACGGSWMVENMLIKEGRFDEITRRVSEVVKQVRVCR